MKAEKNVEVLELIRLLRSWRPKGEIIYRLRELGVSFVDIDAALGGNACSLGGKWARSHCKAWPVEVGK
jgi:hypothetical protein